MFALQPAAMMSLVVMQLSCSDGGDMLLTALPRKDALADFDYVTSVDAVTFSASLLPPPFHHRSLSLYYLTSGQVGGNDTGIRITRMTMPSR